MILGIEICDNDLDHAINASGEAKQKKKCVVGLVQAASVLFLIVLYFLLFFVCACEKFLLFS